MKAIAKSMIRRLVRGATASRYGWAALRPFVAVADYLTYHHADQQPRLDIMFPVDAKFVPHFVDPVVRHGLFKGLRYPGFTSFGSTLFPKLLGSYEREISDIIGKVCVGDYATVLDIGSAEGYYAIGIALRNAQCVVHAYDTNPSATAFCAQMAQLNGVADRVMIGGFCTPETLGAMDLSRKSFILCDCEGYERHLFTHGIAGKLAGCELLIETHDFLDMNISAGLIDVFKGTHRITVIRALDDIDKARSYDYPELEGLSLNDRKALVSEGRPGLMEWLHLEPV